MSIFGEEFIERQIIEGNNTFVWDGIDGLEVNPANIPQAISSITGQGTATTRLPNNVWVGSLSSLINGQEYTFISSVTFTWPYQRPPSPEPQAPSFTYDENFHPLDFNKDNSVDILDVQLGAQLFGESTGQMVMKFIQDENPFDFNGDGIVNITDVVQAGSQGIAPHIIQYMVNLSSTPPYDPTPPVQPNGSTYHPLDLNQDGNVDVTDIVTMTTNNTSFQIEDSAKQIIGQMIVKYSSGENPYDINNDGNVDVLDILQAINAGVPQAILQDMQNNLYTQAPPTPPEPIAPGLHENLYSNGEYADRIKLLRWRGPIHKEVGVNGGEVYFTGATKLPTRRLLVKISDLPNPNVVKDPEGFKTNPDRFLSNGGRHH